MSSRSLKAACFAVAFVLALGTTRSAQAQYSCGQGYGNGYAYQGQSYFGQPSWPPSYGGFQGTSLYGGYPQLPAMGYPSVVPSPVAIPQPSYYSNNYYGSQPSHDHSHHPWHPGHYLLGHY